VERTSVGSSNLASVGYEPVSQVMEVEFVNGRIYEYYGVPESVYNELMGAGSHGVYFSAYVRNIYACSRV